MYTFVSRNDERNLEFNIHDDDKTHGEMVEYFLEFLQGAGFNFDKSIYLNPTIPQGSMEDAHWEVTKLETPAELSVGQRWKRRDGEVVTVTEFQDPILYVVGGTSFLITDREEDSYIYFTDKTHSGLDLVQYLGES